MSGWSRHGMNASNESYLEKEVHLLQQRTRRCSPNLLPLYIFAVWFGHVAKVIQTGRQTDRQKERESVCVHVCVCIREMTVKHLSSPSVSLSQGARRGKRLL